MLRLPDNRAGVYCPSFLHDYIPVLGWTDDVTAAGLIIWFILALIPKEVLEDNKAKKESAGEITEAKKPEDK